MDNGYVMVSERHAAFVADYPNGQVSTRVERMDFDPATGTGMVVMSCSVWKEKPAPDTYIQPDGIGHSGMTIPGSTSFTKGSEVENTETSALGRALAMIGYHPKETMASKEEIAAKAQEKPARVSKTSGESLASAAQLKKMFAMAREAGIDVKEDEGKDLLAAVVLARTGKRSSKQLTGADMDLVYEGLAQMAAELDAIEPEVQEEEEPAPF
jgi:hypothetical protein